MKRLALCILFAGIIAAAQPVHTAVLTWLDALNPSGSTYNVYRAPGQCTGTPAPAFVQLKTGIAALTYTDSPITAGTYCYAVTATVAGSESPQSNLAVAAVQPYAPTGLTVIVK